MNVGWNKHDSLRKTSMVTLWDLVTWSWIETDMVEMWWFGCTPMTLFWNNHGLKIGDPLWLRKPQTYISIVIYWGKNQHIHVYTLNCTPKYVSYDSYQVYTLLNYQILNDVQAASFWLGRHIHPYPCLLKMMNVEEWYPDHWPDNPDCEFSKTWMNSGRCQYKFGVWLRIIHALWYWGWTIIPQKSY